MNSYLFVCLGNICRSPTAKAMFDYKFKQAGIEVFTDSAGTLGYHVGKAPDARAIRHARRWGMDIGDQRARQVTVADFRRFDRIFAMDQSNLDELKRMMPPNATARVELVMSLAPDYGLDEVPDPYYGGDQGFQQVLDMLETAASRLIEGLANTR